MPTITESLLREILQGQKRTNPADISAGRTSGHFPIRIISSHLGIGVEEEDIWCNGGIHPWFQAAEPIRIKAGGSPNDNSSGSGVQKVYIHGLDDNFVFIAEVLKTKGALASAPTTKSFRRVNGARAFRAGVYGGTNEGNIIFEGVVTGGVVGNMFPGTGIVQKSHFTVPADRKALKATFLFVVGRQNSANLTFWFRPGADIVDAPYEPKCLGFKVSDMVGSVSKLFESRIAFEPKTDMWVTGSKAFGGGNAAITVIYELTLRDVN